MNQYQHAVDYVVALTGDVNTPLDWRCIHDKNKGEMGRNLRGTLDECWHELQNYNNQGWGIFVCVNQLDGQGHELSNVAHIRAHMVDLDNQLTSAANYGRAVADGASFAVQTSENKYHAYWKVAPYVGNDFFSLMQRKLQQYYDGDNVPDATRVMRVPGFFHQKNDPVLVSFTNLSGAVYTSDQIQQRLEHVNVFESVGTRTPLGDPSMAAPSLEWLQFAMDSVNPNDWEDDRARRVSFTAAIKQSGWSLTDPDTLYNMWVKWYSNYERYETRKCLKLWDSFRDSEVGWTHIEYNCPIVKAHMMFGTLDIPAVTNTPAPAEMPAASTDKFGEILDKYDCAEYFKGCYFVENKGKIFSQSGRFMNQTQFNGRYGGKQFMLDSIGKKLTDIPYKAATLSTIYTIPKVDHTRFLPEKETGYIANDALGRPGLNTYIPANIDAVEGDVSMWLDHINRILPVQSDQRILFEFMAHCVKYPGFKIPWAPLIQSAEGIGKGVFYDIMCHALGEMYVYSPNAQKLKDSGSTFNAWQRNRLLILVNEIKVDDKRELVEILKPWIADKRIEVQGKGDDQEMEDNPGNWLLFTNYKDAVPIKKDGRRYSPNYSALQTKADILAAGMDKTYFDNMWHWLHDHGGLQAMAYWLLNYPIDKGAIAMVAPETSSYPEALKISASPLETTITDGITNGLAGFRGGYISTLAVSNQCKTMRRRPTAQTIKSCLEQMGFKHLGRSPMSYYHEGVNLFAELYGLVDLDINRFGKVQGYE